MCEHLAELRHAMAAYAASFDASVLSAADARLARDHAAAIEAMAATVKARAATRVAEGGRWRHDGRRSAAHELAAATGTTVAEARDTLALGRRLEGQPEISAAARRGELSAAQSRVIADAAGADPSSAGRLIERAQDRSLAELRDEAARAKAAARPPRRTMGAAAGETPPWPGHVPVPAPAVVHADLVPVQVHDREGRPVTVTARGLMSEAPGALSVADGPWTPVVGWAGPWPAEERWWEASSARRRARFQMVVGDGSAYLVVLEAGAWRLEASYD